MAAKAELKKETTDLQKVEEPAKNLIPITPFEMFDKFADVTREIANLAFTFFRDRGGEFGKELEDWLRAENQILRPVPFEMTESEDKFLLTAPLPDFKPEEIEVSIKDNVLVISGKTEIATENENEETVLREWKSDRFFRQLTLPENVAPDTVTAEFAYGILKLVMPKAPEPKAEKIAVKTA